MDPTDFRNSSAGKCLRAIEGHWAFVPAPIPRIMDITAEVANAQSEAALALGELKGISRILPNPQLLAASFRRREAVLSSRIEGTQTTLSELFLFEAEGEEGSGGSDIREVVNYLNALRYGLKQATSLPLSLRLVRELHRHLLDGVRGQDKTPGQFRQRANRIGPRDCTFHNATYVPPPVSDMSRLLDDWEKFLHDKTEIPALITCAMMHAAFEAIHPFDDGNGRVGRLLIALFLVDQKLLAEPLLYLSAYFERHCEEYYACLLGVTQRGDWAMWFTFFLRAVREQSIDAIATSERLMGWKKEQENRLAAYGGSGNARILVAHLLARPFTSVKMAKAFLNVAHTTAQHAIDRLVEAGILEEITGQARNRIYCAREVLKLLEGSNRES